MKHSLLLVLFAVLFNVMFAHPLQEVNNEGGEEENGQSEHSYRWPNNTVFYEISENIEDDEQKLILEIAMMYLESLVCIKFKPRTNTTKAYLNITAYYADYFNSIGYQNGIQQLNLDPCTCFGMGHTLHELCHALGMQHQHSAWNRDEYISINWENIDYTNQFNYFVEYRPPTQFDLENDYDYSSIMHPPKDAFSKNGKATIVPKDPKNVIGDWENGLSAGDIKRLRYMYECD